MSFFNSTPRKTPMYQKLARFKTLLPNVEFEPAHCDFKNNAYHSDSFAPLWGRNLNHLKWTYDQFF